MSISPLDLIKRLMADALKLRDESERMLFLSIFAAFSVSFSVGIGACCQVILLSPMALVVGSILSSAILMPSFLILGINSWDKLKKRRALSGDVFEFLKFLKDDYDQDIAEIKRLHISDSEKQQLVRDRHAVYVKDRRKATTVISGESQKSWMKELKP